MSELSSTPAYRATVLSLGYDPISRHVRKRERQAAWSVRIDVAQAIAGLPTIPTGKETTDD